MRRNTIIISIVAAVMFSGCGIYNKYSRPEVQTAHLYGTDVAESADTVTLATLSWRERFSPTRSCRH